MKIYIKNSIRYEIFIVSAGHDKHPDECVAKKYIMLVIRGFNTVGNT